MTWYRVTYFDEKDRGYEHNFNVEQSAIDYAVWLRDVWEYPVVVVETILDDVIGELLIADDN